MEIDLKNCTTVLQFLDTVVKELKVSNYFAFNLERLAHLMSSLDKHGFEFPLTLKFINIRNYKKRCPKGWGIFINSLEKVKANYEKRNLDFNYQFSEE